MQGLSNNSAGQQPQGPSSGREGPAYYSNQLNPDGSKKSYLHEGQREYQLGEDGTQHGRKVQLFTQYEGYIGNQIRTSKYHGMPLFIFQNMWFQMHKLANIYFVIIALLQCIPSISISNGQPVILLPLLVVIAVSMLKDYYEDLKRKKVDEQENNREVCILENSGTDRRNIASKDLKVGHIVFLQKDQIIPADLLVLEIADKKKECFVETKNLDGETNLKIKEIPELLRVDKRVWNDPSVDITVEYIDPSKHLEMFHGNLQQSTQGAQPQTDFIEGRHLLLRGCSLRTTSWIKGLVVYTGDETKIQLNSSESEQKLSSLESLMNKFIIVIFLIQIVICLGSGIYGAGWLHEHKKAMKYLRFPKEKAAVQALSEVLQIGGTWILIFTNFIPISLIVTLEMVKYIQGVNLESNENYVACKVQSSNLNEELGQVKYVFSDKTGTLTQNSMKFRCMSLGGKTFGEIDPPEQNQMNPQAQQHYLESHLLSDCVNFYDPLFTNIMSKANDRVRIVQALKHMALCHNVVPLGPSSYSGPSPDEICLVGFAQAQGVQFLKKDDDNYLSLQLRLPGMAQQAIENYRLLHTFDFNSDRKRMSVILQTPQGELLLLTKGADNIMERRLAGMNKYDDVTQSHLNKYSQFGFRTLVLSTRQISSQELGQFEKDLAQAKKLQKGRDEAIDLLQDKMEQNLELLAVTGVEDELQLDVAETISKIKEAGIYFWVLTGDKEETAMSIGYSTKVIGDESNTRIIQISKIIKEIQQEDLLTGKEKQEDQGKLLAQAIDKATKLKDEYKHKEYVSKGIKIALMIKGDDMITISSQPALEKAFLQMAIQCDTVIASRVSPGQKRLIVDLVRNELPDVSTLAIGDGANDVSMINAAHVGIGIRGKEGTQAERASNYAVPEFRYLSRLMFDFGRECYRRNSELVLYNFYKNMLLVLPQWWYGILNGFSGVALYDPWLYQLYNTCFTSLPIVIYAIEDREHSYEELMKNPFRYFTQGIAKRLFNYTTFLQSFLKGALDAGLIMLLSFYCLENLPLSSSSGHLYYFYTTGMVSFGISVLISNLRILSFSHSVSYFQSLIVSGSYVFYMICYALYDKAVKTSDVRNTFGIQYSSKVFYLVNFLAVALTYLIDIGVYVYQTHAYELEQENAKPQLALTNGAQQPPASNRQYFSGQNNNAGNSQVIDMNQLNNGQASSKPNSRPQSQHNLSNYNSAQQQQQQQQAISQNAPKQNNQGYVQLL